MSCIYLGVCEDCRVYIDLDKFFDWCPPVDGDTIIIDTNDPSFDPKAFIERSLRLHAFVNAHSGHRLRVTTDVDWDEQATYQSVFPWAHTVWEAGNRHESSFPNRG